MIKRRTFLTGEVFQTSKSDDILLNTLQENVAIHAANIKQLLIIYLVSFTQALVIKKEQHLLLFLKNKGSRTFLKITYLTNQELTNINNVQVHNTGKNKSVGFINYHINIQGKKNLDSVPKNDIKQIL